MTRLAGTATGSRCPDRQSSIARSSRSRRSLAPPATWTCSSSASTTTSGRTFWNDQAGWNGDWFPLPGQAVFDRDKPADRRGLSRPRQPGPVRHRLRQPRLDAPSGMTRLAGTATGSRCPDRRSSTATSSRSPRSLAPTATWTCSSSASTTTSGPPSGMTRLAGTAAGTT